MGAWKCNPEAPNVTLSLKFARRIRPERAYRELSHIERVVWMSLAENAALRGSVKRVNTTCGVRYEIAIGWKTVGEYKDLRWAMDSVYRKLYKEAGLPVPRPDPRRWNLPKPGRKH